MRQLRWTRLGAVTVTVGCSLWLPASAAWAGPDTGEPQGYLRAQGSSIPGTRTGTGSPTLVPKASRGAASSLPQMPADIPATGETMFEVSFGDSASELSAGERSNLTAHIEAAGRRWFHMLGFTGPRSITVNVEIDMGIPGAASSSAAAVYVGLAGGRSTYEQGAFHELRTGIDPNGSLQDIRMDINLDYLREELWFDPDPGLRSATVPQDRTDAMSVMLHELGHALGYNGWADGNGIPPVSFWSTFDRWMLAGTPTVFTGPAAVAHWGSEPDLTTGNIFHWGNAEGTGSALSPNAEALLGHDGLPKPLIVCDGIRSVDPPVTAEGPVTVLPPGLLGELMNGVVFYRGQRYDISALDIAALTDVALPVDEEMIFGNGFE